MRQVYALKMKMRSNVLILVQNNGYAIAKSKI